MNEEIVAQEEVENARLLVNHVGTDFCGNFHTIFLLLTRRYYRSPCWNESSYKVSHRYEFFNISAVYFIY